MCIKLLPELPLTIVALAVIAAGSPLFGQQEETSTTRLLKSSEADQIAYLNRYIADGAPGDNDDVEILVRTNTSLFVPMLERKIEEILNFPSIGRIRFLEDLNRMAADANESDDLKRKITNLLKN
jgi:hypothetical protein